MSLNNLKTIKTKVFNSKKNLNNLSPPLAVNKQEKPVITALTHHELETPTMISPRAPIPTPRKSLQPAPIPSGLLRSQQPVPLVPNVVIQTDESQLSDVDSDCDPMYYQMDDKCVNLDYRPKIVSVDKLVTWDELHATARPETLSSNYTEMVDTLTASLDNSLLQSIMGSSTLLFTTSLAAAMVSIGVSITSLCAASTSKIMKVLLGTSIVASLASLITTISVIFSTKGISFDAKKVAKEVPTLVETFINSEVTSNSFAWIYPAIAAVVSILIGGLTVFNVCDVKSVIEKGVLLRSAETISRTGKDLTKFLLEDLLQLDVSGDQYAYSELHRWALRSSELATMPYYKFLKDGTLMHELNDAVKKTLPTLSHKYGNKVLNQTTKGAHMIILSNLEKLTQKRCALQAIMDACKRQETLGCLFSGSAGVGKSSLSTYLTNKLASIFGYSTEMYNVNMSRKDGFYGPYGGCDFGVIDEFMGLRANDPNLPQLNQILSGDHFNFEAAHLEGKNQPSALKCLFLTSNNICPQIWKVLDESAAKATWSRILRFEVSDPYCAGRQGDNSHRKKDFSHLKFRFVKTTTALNPSDLELAPVTIDEVIGMLVYQIAKRELNFTNSFLHVNTEKPNASEPLTTQRVEFLQRIVNQNNANSGDIFNVIRLQGPPRAGKTRLASQIANNIQQSYPEWKIYKGFSFNEPPKKRGIYIIDDLIEQNAASYAAYLQWINAGNPSNLYIIATNHEIDRSQTFKEKMLSLMSGADNRHWNVNTYGVSSGIARRLGLHGSIQCSDGTSILDKTATTIIQSKQGNYNYNNIDVTKTEVLSMTYRTFVAAMLNKGFVTLCAETYAGEPLNYDAEVIADNLDALRDTFKDIGNVLIACTYGTRTQIKFTPSLYSAVVSQFNNAQQLLPGRIDGPNALHDQAHAIAGIMNDVKPGLTCRLFIKEGQQEFILHDSTLYIGVQIALPDMAIVHNPTLQQIHFTYQQQRVSVSYAEYTRFVKLGKMPDQLANIPTELVAVLHQYVKQNIGDSDSFFNYHTWMHSIEQHKQQLRGKGLIQYIKDNKALSLTMALVGIVGVASLIKLGIKLFSTKEDSSIANQLSNNDDLDPDIDHFVKSFKTTILQNPAHASVIRQQAYEAGHKAKFDQWEHEWRSNSFNDKDISRQFLAALENADTSTLTNLLLTHPLACKSALYARANQLSVCEEQFQPPSDLEILVKKLRRNYVVVTGYGKVFGLGIGGKDIITVSHCFRSIDESVTISSDGSTYSAKIRLMNRDRDLAVLTVTDKRFKDFPDFRHLLVDEGDFDNISSGYYIRPTITPLIYSTQVQFIHTTSSPKIDTSNPYFRLTSQFWKFTLTGLEDPTRIFKSGDCGLPLLARCGNEYRIIGVHNALQMAGYAWFTSVSKDDLKNIKANSAMVHVNHPMDVTSVYCLDEQMKTALLEPMSTSRYEGVSPLKVYGYSSALKWESHPRHKKEYVDVASKFLTCDTLPSAIGLQNVTDKSKLYAAKNGFINPLFSQAVKYAEVLSTTGTYDPSVDMYVDEMMKAYFELHYPTFKRLTLAEVINGFGQVKPLDMTTSAGPKLKKFYKIHQKRPANDPDCLFTNLNKAMDKPFYVISKTKAGETLKRDYDLYRAAIEQGTPVLTIIKDNAKVELLLAEKVREGKVRLFNEMDLSINMMLKHYFGTFMDAVISKHQTHVFCIGMNPYLDASMHMLQLNAMPGEFVNADFKAMDKTTPAVLIASFVECVFRDNLTNAQKDAIYRTLTYTCHSMDGNIYFIGCGNESGSYVTTLLNCFSVFKVSLYTFVRRWKEEFNHFPSYKEIFDNVIFKILGDDAIRKFSPVVEITMDQLVHDAALYGLTQTPAKTPGEISFCSRVYVEVAPFIYCPLLKQSSIKSCLFWLNRVEPIQITQNIFVALLEASFHGVEFFNKVKSAAMELCRTFKVEFDFIPWDVYRSHFIEYVRGNSNSPVFKERGNFLSQENNSMRSNSHKNFQTMADMWLNNYVMYNKLSQPVHTFERDGEDHMPQWSCTTNLNVQQEVYTHTGFGTSKSEAKRNAAAGVKAMIADCNDDSVIIDGQKRLITPEKSQELRSMFGLTADSKTALTFEVLDGKLPEEKVKSNADMPIEPATMNQASTGQAIASIPFSTNPQPTGVVPAMTSSGEDIMANLQYAEQQVLNPVGAPNMLSVGAITFDVKNLIYEQYLDSDVEFEITDDLPSGSIIAQIPYGVNHPFVNRYIKSYSSLHERYAGAINYRFTVIGNPLFSGALGIAWRPARVTTSTMLISEAQKYAYSAKGVTMPWNAIHTLHDGRQELFWRKTNEVIDDNRPHLVVFLLMSLQNPLREGVITRLRIASKLTNQGEPNPFVFANPDLDIIPPEPELRNALAAQQFNDVFVNATNQSIKLYTDGITVTEQNFGEQVFYPDFDYRSRTQGTAKPANGPNDAGSCSTVRYYASVEHSIFASQWPNLNTYLIELSPPIDGPTIVSAMVTSNMDSKSLATLVQACPTYGFRSGTSQILFTQSNWSAMKNNSSWAASILTRLDAPVKLLAVTYDDTIFPYGSSVYGGRPEIYLCGGNIKVITDKGTALFTLLCFASPAVSTLRTITEMYERAGNRPTVTTPDIHMADLPLVPYLNLDLNFGFLNPSTIFLPLGYQSLRITEINPSSLTIADYTGPTSTDNATISRWFRRKAIGLSLTQCLQFRLVDTNSVRTIATVRYLQEYGQFCIYNPTPDAYRVLQIDTTNITIQQVVVVDRTNDFAATNTFAWLPRTSPTFLKSLSAFKSFADSFDDDGTPNILNAIAAEECVSSNAMLAAAIGGGAMQGIGQALGQQAQNKFELQKQGNQFKQEQTLQSNLFGHNVEMQGNMFDFQTGMQSNNFDFQKLMQQNQFGQDQNMLAKSSIEERKTNRAQTENNMLARGLSSRMNFARNGESFV